MKEQEAYVIRWFRCRAMYAQRCDNLGKSTLSYTLYSCSARKIVMAGNLTLSFMFCCCLRSDAPARISSRSDPHDFYTRSVKSKSRLLFAQTSRFQWRRIAFA